MFKHKNYETDKEDATIEAIYCLSLITTMIKKITKDIKKVMSTWEFWIVLQWIMSIHIFLEIEHDLMRSFFKSVLDNDLKKSLEIIDLVKEYVFFKCQTAGGNLQIALNIHFVAAGY